MQTENALKSGLIPLELIYFRRRTYKTRLGVFNIVIDVVISRVILSVLYCDFNRLSRDKILPPGPIHLSIRLGRFFPFFFYRKKCFCFFFLFVVFNSLTNSTPASRRFPVVQRTRARPPDILETRRF